jgi:hypothetical protein
VASSTRAGIAAVRKTDHRTLDSASIRNPHSLGIASARYTDHSRYLDPYRPHRAQ